MYGFIVVIKGMLLFAMQSTVFAEFSSGSSPAIGNMFCISHEFKNIVCTWEVRKSDTKTNWTVSYYQEELHTSYLRCPSFSESKTNISCKLNEEEDAVVHIFPYNVSVLGQNHFGSTFQSYKLIIPEIVKPCPVSELNATATNSTITLSWTVSYRLIIRATTYTLAYRILYWSQYDISKKKKIIYDDRLKQATKINLAGIRPYALYNITVSSKVASAGEEYWSEETSTTVQTKGAVPSCPPRTMGDLYFIKDYMLYIFVKSYDQKDINSQDVELKYEIVIEDIINTYTTVTKDVSATIDLSLREHQLTNNTKLYIFAKNHIGRSNESARISLAGTKIFKGYIWTEYNEDSNVTEIVIQTESSLFLNITKVSSFWCIRKSLSENPICESNVSWSESSYIQPISIKPQRKRYSWMFGAAFMYENWRSDGLHFSDCDYGYSQTGSLAEREIRILKAEGYSSSITLLFAFDTCRDLPSRPLYYLVYYGEKEHVAGKTCGDGSGWNLHNVTAFGVKNITLPHIDRNKTWGICMQIVTYKGRLDSKVGTNTLSLESSKTDEHNTIALISTVSAVCFVFVFVLLGYYTWRLRKSWQQDDDITLPAIPNRHKPDLLENTQSHTNRGMSLSSHSNSSSRSRSSSESEGLTAEHNDTFFRPSLVSSSNLGTDNSRTDDDHCGGCQSMRMSELNKDMDAVLAEQELPSVGLTEQACLTGENVSDYVISAMTKRSSMHTPVVNTGGYVTTEMLAYNSTQDTGRETNVQEEKEEVKSEDAMANGNNSVYRQISEDEGFSSLKEQDRVIVDLIVTDSLKYPNSGEYVLVPP